VKGDNQNISSNIRMTYAKKAVKHRIAAHNDQTGYDQTYMASPAKISRLGAKVQPTRKPNANIYWDRQRQDEKLPWKHVYLRPKQNR